jgi:NADH-quinone oxidoreductase subunit N
MFPVRLATLQGPLLNDLVSFLPELVLVVTIVFLLAARLVKVLDVVHLTPIAAVGAAAALALVVPLLNPSEQRPIGGPAFTGLLALDPFAATVRGLVLLTAFLVLLLGLATGVPDREDSADFGALVLGAALGMMLMASANHLLVVFLAVEMASLPSYALAGFLKGRPKGSEAALKYVVFGAAASGVMLYGISLLTARFGTGSLSGVRMQLANQVANHGWDPQLVAGVLFLCVGLGYKVSAVPFHLWLPDAFEGAAAEIGAFLSVASKAAALGLAARVVYRLAFDGDTGLSPPYYHGLTLTLQIAAAVTATVGNLAAYGQTNLKRLLAYSTVAHAGYMLMAIAPVGTAGPAAVLVYLAAYLPANLGAFAVVAAVRNRTGSEDLAAVRGLVSRSPVLGVGLAVCLMSLLGLPPLAGFTAKFQVFSAVYDVGANWLLAVGIVNTVVSAGYYLKVLRTIGLDDPADPTPLAASVGLRAIVFALAVTLVVLGLAWGPVAATADKAALIRGY